MSIYSPYFYIIQHKSTGKKYAGCRFAKKCHPNEFMKPNGYLTSSKKIKNIIKEQGLNSFEILEVKVFSSKEEVFEYETQFLIENNCANSDEWYNFHNNDGGSPVYGSEEFKKLMLYKYGVDNWVKTKEAKIMVSERNKKLWQENRFCRERVKELQKIAIIAALSPESNEKRKQTLKNIRHQQGEKNNQFGTCWITNGIENRKIKKENEIPNGWRKGRVL